MAKQNLGNDQLNAYYQEVYSAIEDKTMADDFGKYVLHRVKGGQKTVFNKTQTEIRNFDMSFLDTIESVYPAILKIMRDPKRSLRYEEEVVSVEKARKVNSQTVRHLTSHTQLIKEITKEGDVIPSKVLTTYAEEELATYENRFIKSLVRRMEMFIERRYEVMKVSLESFETERLSVKNEFLMSGQKVTFDLDIQIKNDLTTNVETTKEQYNRLLYVREMVQGLKGTDFMRALAKAKDVLPPIMKTNIILHNPDFKLCYGLWLYLDRVDGISTNIDAKEKTYKYSSIFDRDINQCMALALTSFMKNRGIEGVRASKNLPSQKAPKPIENEEIELELNLNADNKKLEDYTMNQLLLDQTASFFEASLSGMQRTGNTYNESIRVVYRQMLDMLDQIYPKAFGVADDQLESKNLYEQLEYARRRQMIIKIVRQQKQMNMLRMAKEEKRIEKLLTTLDNKIKVQEEKERQRLEKQRQKEEAARLAAIEKEKALAAKKKKLEEEALARQKAAEKKSMAKKKVHDAEEIKKLEKQTRAMEIAAKRREHLKSLKEAKNAQADNAEEIQNAEAEDTVLEEAVAPEAVESQADVQEAPAQEVEAQEAPVEEQSSEEDEFEAAMNAIPEASEEPAQAEELAEEEPSTEEPAQPVEESTEANEEVAEAEAPVEEQATEEAQTQEEVSEETPQEEALSEEDEFEAAMNAIPEATEEPAQAEELAEEEPSTEESIEETSTEEPLEEPAQEEVQEAEPTEDDEFEAAMNAIPEAAEEAPQEEEQPAEEAPQEETPSEEDEFEAAMNAIPEAQEQPAEESQEEEEVIYVDEDGNPVDPPSEDDEFEAAMNAIPEAEGSSEEDDEFLAAMNAIPEAQEQPAEEPQEEEEVIYVDEDGNPVDAPEEVIYVDEDGNPIEGYDPNIMDEAADDYERMLKESGMTDEEIAALLGED